MTLYKLTTEGLGDFYIVADDPTKAERILTTELNKADYGFSNRRTVTNIAVITQEIPAHYRDTSKLNFSSGDRLIVQRKN